MNQPSVSIIVPVYNVEPYVEDCIRSVMRQTYDGPMECIVVDDCGTDNSMAVVERVIAKYNGPIAFKIMHHEHNRGLSAARNTGMDAAKGDYLFFLDSDDEITDDCIKKLVSAVILDSTIEIVQGNTKRLPNKNTNEFPINILITHARSNNEVRSSFFQEMQFRVYVWNKLILRSFIVKNNLKFKDGLLWEDNLWHFFLLKIAKNVFFISDITYLYKYRDNSIISGTNWRTENIHYAKIYREILSNLTPNHEKEELVFYIARFPKRYKGFPDIYKDVYSLFWKKTLRYKCYYCCKILIVAYLSRSELGRIMISIIWRLKHLLFLRKK